MSAPPKPQLRVEHDSAGRAVRVFIGPLDITHLVLRVQTMTTNRVTTTEVVLAVLKHPTSSKGTS